MFADKQGLSVMVFSTDESTNKAVVCAGVPEKGDKGKLDVSEWLSNALGPLKGRCGKGKGGLATGQVSILPISYIMSLGNETSNNLSISYIMSFKVMNCCKKICTVLISIYKITYI
jgi:hypothetical protein